MYGKLGSRVGALAVATAAGAGLMGAPAGAAEPGTLAATLDEVVVTARKREESLLAVPIAITAISAADMERSSQRSIGDIAASVPGLNINSDFSSRAFVSIRGIGTALQAGVQPGIGLFQDGIYVPYTSYINSPTLDVARIEVLRGPQGTLYGKNTLGGAINVITRPPGDRLEGRVVASYSDGDDSREIGARISGPIVDGTLSGRLAVNSRRSDGFFENKLIGGDVAPLDSDQVNGTLLWKAGGGTSLTLNGYWLDVQGGGAYGHVNGPRDYRDNVRINVLNRNDFTYKGGNARLEVPLAGIETTMTVIGAFDRRDFSAVSDGDFLSLDIVRSRGNTVDETATLELRFDTQFGERFSTLLGFFGSREETTALTAQTLVPASRVTTAVAEREGDTWSVFGTGVWRLRDDLELSAGLRFDKERRTQDSSLTVSTAPGVVLTDPSRRIESSEVEPRVSLTKFLRPDLTVYGSVAKGYRGGGFNAASVPAQFSTYGGDTVWTYEIGSKGRYADNRIYTSVAAFYNDYEDFIGQNALTIGPGGGLVSVDLNLGNVESYGVEAEASVQVTNAWRLGGALTLMRARITDQSGWLRVTGTPLATDRLLFQPD
jgi:iron complex outermembrane recepter protein